MRLLTHLTGLTGLYRVSHCRRVDAAERQSLRTVKVTSTPEKEGRNDGAVFSEHDTTLNSDKYSVTFSCQKLAK